MSLAQRVRDYRYSKGWGPDELAVRAAISRTALYQIESGKTELPRAATLRRIALALDVSTEALLGHAAGDDGGREQGASAARARRLRPVVERVPDADGPWGPRPALAGQTIADPEGSVFAIKAQDCSPIADPGSPREQELVAKLHVLLASPLGDGVVRIIDELYRTLPDAPDSRGGGLPGGLEKIG